MFQKILISISLFCAFLIPPTKCCRIWGSDTGECSLLPLNDLWRAENMPYCYDYVKYATCLPKLQTIPPSREYPDGRWFNHTVRTKDNWVGIQTGDMISTRRSLEMNKTLKSIGKNEYGDKGKIIKRFFHNADCQNAYKAYFCWINFPRCDDALTQSLPTCRSACHNFFKSCKYASDLFRCYESKYFNGREAESPTGNRTYLRDFFPGQPFRQNEFTKKGKSIAVCTPSLDGAAASSSSFNMLLLYVLCIVTILFTLVI